MGTLQDEGGRQVDRRKRKSKQAIFNACAALIQEYEFENITVQQIAEKADLNRGTFYLHYSDKYDMISHYEDELIEKIKTLVLVNLTDVTSIEQFLATRYCTIIALLNCLKHEQELFHFILKTRGSASLETKLKHLLHHVAFKEIFLKFPEIQKQIPVDFASTLFVSLVLSLAKELDSFEQALSSEELATFIIDVALNGPARVLGFVEGEKIDITSIINVAPSQ